MNYGYPQEEQRSGIDGLTVAAVLFLLFMAFNIFRDRDHPGSGPIINLIGIASKPDRGSSNLAEMDNSSNLSTQTQASVPSAAVFDQSSVSIQPQPYDPEAFDAPYTDYVITQGLHGYSYGHMAIDIAGGKGAQILAPISGTITDISVDRYGNTTLVIENEIYRVTFLHGDYDVDIDDWVIIGDPVGRESNHGYTTDMQGRPCAGRDCGYHSHLNVYDKRLNLNVNPLDLLAQ
jgi:murein DD-endopeptidase MepM/ murein hydrolase activator NlpD